MKEKILLGIVIGLAIVATAVLGQYMPPSVGTTAVPFNLLGEMAPSVAVTDDALSGVRNPAGLGVRKGVDLFLLAPYDERDMTNDIGLYLRLGGLGFATEWVRRGNLDYERYMLADGIKFAPGVYVGASYSWWRGLDHTASWSVGMIGHPCRYFSLGMAFDDINQPMLNGQEQRSRINFGAAVRPMVNWLTLSADVQLYETQTVEYGDEAYWNFRVEAEPVKGIHVSGNYHPETDLNPATYGLGLGLSNGFGRIGDYSAMDKDGKGNGGVSYVQFSSGYQRSIFEPRHRFVSMKLAGDYPEEKPGFRLFGPRKVTFTELLKRIGKLERDSHVDGISLTIGDLSMSFAQYQELREALVSFKQAGKKIVTYMETCGNMEYYLASVSDIIAVNPAGDMGLRGIVGEAMFLKGTLDKLGIKAELYHIAEYKTASDMLTRDSMSDAHREMLNSILDDLYNQVTETIAQSRGMTVDDFKALVDKGPYTANSAYKAGLIDTLLYQDQISDLVKEIGGKGSALVAGNTYWNRQDYETEWETPFVKKIAIIYATGLITSGESGDGFITGKTMGSETIAKAIRKARNDPQVKAIVFRINSGGGSALASDVISREVQLTVEGEKAKPFIVSMGGVAGSGGYYIACLADTIVADPGTITASIGVITGKFNFKGLYDKLGINFEQITRGEHADIMSEDRGFTEDEWKIIKEQCHEVYDQFRSHVAKGRNLSMEEVDRIGRGRVWTGNQAQKIGLVDEIGGLRLALEIARKRAGITDEQHVVYSTYPESRGFTFGAEVEGIISDYLSPEIRAMASEWNKTQVYRDGEPLLLMPFELEVQ
jgi:protease-4